MWGVRGRARARNACKVCVCLRACCMLCEWVHVCCTCACTGSASSVHACANRVGSTWPEHKSRPAPSPTQPVSKSDPAPCWPIGPHALLAFVSGHKTPMDVPSNWHPHACSYMHAHAHTHIHTSTHRLTQSYCVTRTPVYVSMGMSASMHTHTHTHTRTHTHTHTHTHMQACPHLHVSHAAVEVAQHSLHPARRRRVPQRRRHVQRAHHNTHGAQTCPGAHAVQHGIHPGGGRRGLRGPKGGGPAQARARGGACWVAGRGRLVQPAQAHVHTRVNVCIRASVRTRTHTHVHMCSACVCVNMGMRQRAGACARVSACMCVCVSACSNTGNSFLGAARGQEHTRAGQ